MIKITDIWTSFGEQDVLKGVTLSLPRGSLTGIIGPSGGGKSVLLKVIAGIIEATKGAVETEGAQPSLMFQEGALFDSLNVFENVSFPLVHGRLPLSSLTSKEQSEVSSKVSKILDHVGLLWASSKMPGELSGGMRKRVSLARALVGDPRFVLLDDPTSGLDPVASSVIMNLIVKLHQELSPTMLIVSHDLRRLLPVVEKVVGLFDGKIQFEGTVEELSQSDCITTKRFVSCRYDLEEGRSHAPS